MPLIKTAGPGHSNDRVSLAVLIFTEEMVECPILVLSDAQFEFKLEETNSSLRAVSELGRAGTHLDLIGHVIEIVTLKIFSL